MKSPEVFLLKSYAFDAQTKKAEFRYEFDNGAAFVESLELKTIDEDYDEAVLSRALRLAHIVAGTSYYKCFPEVRIEASYPLSEVDAAFISTTYRDGMGQFIYENRLEPTKLGRVDPSGGHDSPVGYSASGVLALQSGGKDSLLLAELLKLSGTAFSTFYISSSSQYPAVLDTIGASLRPVRRSIDSEAIRLAKQNGALDGHIPISYIVYAYALVDAVLHNEATVLMAVGREGEESHAVIGDLAVTHQWSKTWRAEQLFANYVQQTVSPDIQIGSPLRQWSELRIAELFSKLAWQSYANQFSSCNIGNYQQGQDNRNLVWCGACPKCANSYLLFAAFIDGPELQRIFGGEDLFAKSELQDVYRGLLGIEGAEKPFECIGEIEELRAAYHMAQRRPGYAQLSFSVPDTEYDYVETTEAQSWTNQFSSVVEKRGL